jgi:hypothetical protein
MMLKIPAQPTMRILCCAASPSMELFRERKDVNVIGGISIMATEEKGPNVSEFFIQPPATQRRAVVSGR